MNENIIRKLRIISKSKCGTFLNCRWGFKLSYIDGVEQSDNMFLRRGSDVHSFHEKFLKRVKIKDGQLIIPKFKAEEIVENEKYKKNVVMHHIKRWEKCVKEKGRAQAHKYFLPIINEERIDLEHLELCGVPDVIARDLDGKAIAIEVKTGAPNATKVKNYKEDLIWYKLIVEAKYPKYGSIDSGVIYFPENNYTYRHKLTDADVIKLLKKITKARNDIMECIRTGIWEPSPEKKKCDWCLMKSNCEFRAVK